MTGFALATERGRDVKQFFACDGGGMFPYVFITNYFYGVVGDGLRLLGWRVQEAV
jgi:hypothetical protein